MRVRTIKPSIAFSIKEFERGVKLRFGKSKGVVGPGLHPAIPGVDEIRIVDVRPQQFEVSFDVLTQDNYPLTTKVNVRYSVVSPEDAIVRAPEDVEPQIETLLRSEAGRAVCGTMTMDNALKKREDLGNSVRAFLRDHVSTWGIDIETVQVKEVTPPSEVHELQRELYTETVKRVIDPMRARTEAEVYRAKAGAELDMMKQYFSVITDVAGELAKQYGPKDARDIMYILFAKNLGDQHPLVQKMRTKMAAEGVAEGAASAAETIGADPKYAYLMTALQNMKGLTVFDVGPFESLKDLDERLTRKLYGK